MHEVLLESRAERDLKRLSRDLFARLIAAIQTLADDPRPPGCKKLSGRPAWRIHVGVYRVIYEIHDDRMLVLVVAIGHRKDVYR